MASAKCQIILFYFLGIPCSWYFIAGTHPGCLDVGVGPFDSLKLHQRLKKQARPCSSEQWRCSSGACIELDGLCDGAKDCGDGSDERAAACSSVSCPAYLFRCNYGACVDGDARCNGVSDCADGSDENPNQCSGDRLLISSLPLSTTRRPMTFLPPATRPPPLPPSPPPLPPIPPPPSFLPPTKSTSTSLSGGGLPGSAQFGGIPYAGVINMPGVGYSGIISGGGSSAGGQSSGGSITSGNSSGRFQENTPQRAEQNQNIAFDRPTSGGRPGQQVNPQGLGQGGVAAYGYSESSQSSYSSGGSSFSSSGQSSYSNPKIPPPLGSLSNYRPDTPNSFQQPRRRQCLLPPYPVNGYYVAIARGFPGDLETYVEVHHSCEEGYNLIGKTRNRCYEGSWELDNPVCERECKPLPILDAECFDRPSAPRTPCDSPQRSMTTAIVKCKNKYGYPVHEAVLTCVNGKWDKEVPLCASGVATRQTQMKGYEQIRGTENGNDYNITFADGKISVKIEAVGLTKKIKYLSTNVKTE